jgi:hypothetical protein
MPSNADGPFEVLMSKFLWTAVRRRNIRKHLIGPCLEWVEFLDRGSASKETPE